jgi:hypothetical protein
MIPADQGLADDCVFYNRLLETLTLARLPFLVGGAYAFNCYVPAPRPTRDLDLFFKREDYALIAQSLRAAGYQVDPAFPHWLAKVRQGDTYVDLIYSSGNGVAAVDDLWFRHAPTGIVLGMEVKLLPAEELIWSKAYIMERERYDGADIAHLIHACAEQLDWTRLLARFGPHWRVLLSHLVLFGFIYPDERTRIPTFIMGELIERLALESEAPARSGGLCNGPLLSREQYLTDIAQGCVDGRIAPPGRMTEKEIASWTAAIPLDE